MTKILDEIALWLLVGLVAAALVMTFVPPNALSQWGSGVFAMLAMVAIGVPMYVCATASLPLAASMLLAGVSPGTALVFLLAGPATNIGSLAVIRNAIGTWATAAHLLGICGGAIAFGLLTDYLASLWAIQVQAQVEHSHEMLPAWLSITSAVILLLFAIRPLRNLLFNMTRRRAQQPAPEPTVAADHS